MKHLLLLFCGVVSIAKAASVSLVELPEQGVQPQALTDAAGKLHVVYLAGPADVSDVYHTTLDAGTMRFDKPQRVNSTPGNAVAMGSIRGAQAAWGKDGRLHVVWNGTVHDAGGKSHMELRYTRTKPGSGEFETERGLMTETKFLDGGVSVAADANGNVYVVCHAMPVSATPEPGHGERMRRLYIARSEDNGATFAPAVACPEVTDGICGCCSLKATTFDAGELAIVFRGADDNGRNMISVTSKNHAANFQRAELQPWNIKACPMSSSSLQQTPHGLMAAWETDGCIWMRDLKASNQQPRKISPSGSKHPSIAVDMYGQLLVTWAQGTGWQRGGTLGWKIFGTDGLEIPLEVFASESERKVPVWSFPVAAWVPKLGFVIVH